MPKVHFTADMDWKPSPQVTVAYRAGDEKLVTTACADRAFALGRAVPIEEAPPAGIAETISRKPRKREPANG